VQRILPSLFLVLAVAAMAAACDGSKTPTSPTSRTSSDVVTVRISTSGTQSNLDADGYFLSWDFGTKRSVGVQDSVSVYGLNAGTHSVQLDGIADNCKVTSGNPVLIELGQGPGKPVSVSFSVSCVDIPACYYCWDY
jgi:hypothetical protein